MQLPTPTAHGRADHERDEHRGEQTLPTERAFHLIVGYQARNETDATQDDHADAQYEGDGDDAADHVTHARDVPCRVGSQSLQLAVRENHVHVFLRFSLFWTGQYQPVVSEWAHAPHGDW